MSWSTIVPAVVERAYARAGLVGNPSDGYGGKTISMAIREFFAEVALTPAPAVSFDPDPFDGRSFASLDLYRKDVRMSGYYGANRLLRAAAKRFADYADRTGQPCPGGFRASFRTNIPRQVGLAGSSAIVVAMLRALTRFFGVAIPDPVMASLALAVEKDELGIAAGLQDRVAQTYRGLVFMDFSAERRKDIDGYATFAYERLDPGLLPPLYLAWHKEFSEPTEVFHQDLRARFDRGDPAVTAAMRRFAELTDMGRAALIAGDHRRFGEIMNANFDLRRSICRLPDWQIAQIEAARAAGCPAKFAGSGGAIVGICPDEAAFDRLAAALDRVGSAVIRPTVAL